MANIFQKADRARMERAAAAGVDLASYDDDYAEDTQDLVPEPQTPVMKIAVAFIKLLIAFFTPFAGVYRVAMWKLRTFPGKKRGWLVWLGIFVVLPAFDDAASTSDPQGFINFWYAWLGLIVWGYIQMMAKWASPKTPRDEGEFHCWFGRAEFVFAFSLAATAEAFCNSGVAMFVVYGFVASSLQAYLIRLQRWCTAWSPEDTRNAVAPIRKGAALAGRCTVLGASRTRLAIRMAITAMMPFGFLLWGRARNALAAKPLPEGATPTQPTFTNRVATSMVAQGLLGLCTGSINLFSIFRIICMVLAIPAAIGLRMLGYHVGAPEDVKDDINEAVVKGKEIAGEWRDEAAKRAHEEAIELKRQLRESREEIEAKAKQRFEEEKEKLQQEAEERASRAFWKTLTPWR